MSQKDEVTGVLAMVPVGEKDRNSIPYDPIPSMVHHLCEKCPTVCWTGPRQLAMKKENPNMPMLCMNCVMGIAIKEKEAGNDVVADVISLGG